MSRIRNSQGQILPVLLAVIALAVTAMLLTQRMNRAVTQEIRLVNAADAAAYSAATWTARRLNLIAYTNRAMVANHIAVGHLVAYISWLRYVDEGAGQLARYTSYLPYVGTATRIAQRLVRTGLITSERMSWGYINGIDALHTLMHIAQLDARRQLQTKHLNAIMQSVADQHDRAISINAAEDLEKLPNPYSAGLRSLLTAQSLAGFARLQTARPGQDKNYFTGLLNRTLNHDPDLSRWLRGSESGRWPLYIRGARNWSFRIPFVIQFQKQGATNRARLPDAGGWRSRDRLQVRTFEWGKGGWGWTSWRTLAKGSADANRLAGGYTGVRRYTRLRDRNEPGYRFTISALATTPVPGAKTDEAVQSHLSMAEVAYRIPDKCGPACPRRSEPATLFNPYWEARLIGAEVPGIL